MTGRVPGRIERRGTHIAGGHDDTMSSIVTRRRWIERSPHWLRVASIAAIALAVAVVLHPAPLPGEIGYIRRMQALGSPVPGLAKFVRATTSTEASLIVMLPGAFWAVRRHARRGVLAIVISLATMLAVQPLVKELIDRPRPDSSQVEVRAEHTSMSFPSGHSMSTATVWGAAALTAWQCERRRYAVVAATPVVLTGLSSGIQGVHWPTDAVAGTALGAVAAWAIAVTLTPAGAPDGDVSERSRRSRRSSASP